ncbi:hypothetical protein EON78_02625 [bacterium]|nr:MAG: hypothetical protein EON78_02625 [bacterium]
MPVNSSSNSTQLEVIDTPTDIKNSIKGDFDGDGLYETAQIELIKPGIIGEKSWEMKVNFSNPKIKAIQFQSEQEYSSLINEGNLNNTPGDEISILIPPANGNMYYLKPYKLQGGEWKELFEGFLTPSSILFLNDNNEIDPGYIEFEERLFIDKDTVYYYDYQNVEFPDDEQEFRFVKVKAELKHK